MGCGCKKIKVIKENIKKRTQKTITNLSEIMQIIKGSTNENK